MTEYFQLSPEHDQKVDLIGKGFVKIKGQKF